MTSEAPLTELAVKQKGSGDDWWLLQSTMSCDCRVPDRRRNVRVQPVEGLRHSLLFGRRPDERRERGVIVVVA